jgi:hypothetical protein
MTQTLYAHMNIIKKEKKKKKRNIRGSLYLTHHKHPNPPEAPPTT